MLWPMLNLCKGKPLPFAALQMADRPDSTLDALLQPRSKGLKKMQKVWGEGAAAEQYCHGSLCPGMVK
ncbi:hypothetical protein GW17_00044636 [Ensete ventricosum]|nr:hypothetical protein GW17_00044636 [Ensete ventricosum]